MIYYVCVCLIFMFMFVHVCLFLFLFFLLVEKVIPKRKEHCYLLDVVFQDPNVYLFHYLLMFILFFFSNLSLFYLFHFLSFFFFLLFLFLFLFLLLYFFLTCNQILSFDDFEESELKKVNISSNNETIKGYILTAAESVKTASPNLDNPFVTFTSNRFNNTISKN